MLVAAGGGALVLTVRLSPPPWRCSRHMSAAASGSARRQRSARAAPARRPRPARRRRTTARAGLVGSHSVPLARLTTGRPAAISAWRRRRRRLQTRTGRCRRRQRLLGRAHRSGGRGGALPAERCARRSRGRRIRTRGGWRLVHAVQELGKNLLPLARAASGPQRTSEQRRGRRDRGAAGDRADVGGRALEAPSRMSATARAAARIAERPCSGRTPAWAARPRKTAPRR